jgi:hypothetical protein
VAIRVLLSGRSWADDAADPFEGLTPKQITEYLAENKIDPTDPFAVSRHGHAAFMSELGQGY